MSSSAGINKRSLVLDDLRDIAALSAASFSADDAYLVYVITNMAWEENEYRDRIALVELSSGRQIKSLEGYAPQWSPVANELAYLSSYQGETYIWIYSMPEDSQTPLAPVYESHYFMGHLSVKNFAWSPDGSKIAYVSTHPFTAQASDLSDIQVIDRLLYKTKGGRGRPLYADDRLSHIWVVTAHGGDPKLVTDTAYNEHSICWAPDGAKIAFVSNRTEDPDDNQFHDLCTVNLITEKITRHTELFGTVYQPAWSPDGQDIAFLGTRGRIATNDGPAEDTQLYILSADDNSFRCLTFSFDRRVEQASWHRAGRVLYFTAGDQGTTAIYRVAVNGQSIEQVTGNSCQVLEYSINQAGDTVCYVHTDSTHPTELFLFNLNDRSKRQITQHNEPLVQSCSLQQPETFRFKSFDQTAVQGWIMKPADFNTQQKYPLVLVIHGGPHNMFGYGFEDRMQLLSAKGYGVLFINPRGSTGYGQTFANGTLLNWGGGDYKDLMAGVDAAINKNDWVDADRLGVTGQSYGGYMTNWIITQTSRFKAAVVDGGISNLVSFAGTSLYHSLIESEFNGSAYHNYPLLWQWSPLRHVEQVSTPTLILHGALDNEVPLSQAEEMYIALKKLGVTTRLVQYLSEGHGWRPDLKPWNRHDLIERTIEWFDKCLASSH